MRTPPLKPVVVALVLAVSVAIGVSADDPLTSPVSDARIVVFKGERILQLFAGKDLVREYRIGLGFEPVGDKGREGDGATPEGFFRVCIENPQSQYYLSLGLDYPGVSDAARGLQTGMISQSQYDQIVEALKEGRCPPWNTALGGEIFIHGRGSTSDWTLGCVALDDGDMKELFAAVGVGTPVEIRK